MSLRYLDWDDEVGWAAVGCAMPPDADLEGLPLDERELREGVAAGGRRRTPESPCLANRDGVLLWVSLVDDPLGHGLVPDKGAFRSKTLAGLGAEARRVQVTTLCLPMQTGSRE
jgi:hypothetical protein